MQPSHLDPHLIMVLGSQSSVARQWLSDFDDPIFQVSFCDDSGDLLRMIRERVVSSVLIDYDQCAVNLEQLLELIHQIDPVLPVVLISDQNTCIPLSLYAAGILGCFSTRHSIQEIKDALLQLIKRQDNQRMERAAAKSYQSQLEIINHRHHQLDMKLKELMHELNTPIAVIQGYCSNMLAELEGPLSSSQRNCLERMQCSCDLVMKITRQVHKETSQVTGEYAAIRLNVTQEKKRESRTSQRRQIRLGDLAQEVIAMLKPAFNEKHVSLSLEIDQACPAVWANRTRITQLLLNLLSNALRHTPKRGRVKVLVETEPAQDAHERAGVRISVKDNGAGIAEENLEKIFNPQWSFVPGSHEPRAGLGLAICKEVAREHKGRLWVKSRLGQGSTFHFVLPVDPRMRAWKLSLDIVEDSVLAGQLLVELGKMKCKPEAIRHPACMEDLAQKLRANSSALVFFGPADEHIRQALQYLESLPDPKQNEKK